MSPADIGIELERLRARVGIQDAINAELVKALSDVRSSNLRTSQDATRLANLLLEVSQRVTQLDHRALALAAVSQAWCMSTAALLAGRCPKLAYEQVRDSLKGRVPEAFNPQDWADFPDWLQLADRAAIGTQH